LVKTVIGESNQLTAALVTNWALTTSFRVFDKHIILVLLQISWNELDASLLFEFLNGLCDVNTLVFI
jgi:hypothetical protein